MTAARRKQLSGLPVGTRWESIYNDVYEVTGFYTMGGKNFYHIKLNGKHITEGVNSTRLIPEEEVKEMRVLKKK
jgi:hypothetical protein